MEPPLPRGQLRARALVVALMTLAAAACMGGRPSHPSAPWSQTVAGVRFVRAAPVLIARCRATASVLGYPVPCPTRVPAGLAGWPSGETIIGPATLREKRRLRIPGWAFGSSAPPHLVIEAAPRPLTNLHHAVDGPGFDAHSFVGRRGCFPRGGTCHPLLNRLETIPAHGWRVHLVEATHWDESAFTHHLVMVWTVAGHTYAAGFHEVQGRAAARRWDAELLRGLRLVPPLHD